MKKIIVIAIVLLSVIVAAKFDFIDINKSDVDDALYAVLEEGETTFASYNGAGAKQIFELDLTQYDQVDISSSKFIKILVDKQKQVLKVLSVDKRNIPQSALDKLEE